jgi:hypothetical protein
MVTALNILEGQLFKICNKCKIEKDLSEFPKDATRKDGFYLYCKLCCAAKHKKYKMLNYDKVCDSNKYYYQNKGKFIKLPAKVREHSRKQRKKHPEKAFGTHAVQYIKTPTGFVKHHHCYQIAFVKDVFILPYKMHCYIHRYLKYDPIAFKYRTRFEGVLLENREMHRLFIISLIKGRKNG